MSQSPPQSSAEHDSLNANLSHYRYDELPKGAVFRYLVLHAGKSDEPLECSLHVAAIAGTDYEAISYVWGTDVKTHSIACNGAVIAITANLHGVLRRVRLAHQARRLWADSVCIDQGDLREKGHQVANMAHIYESATRVLVYMGHDDDGYGAHLEALLAAVEESIARSIAHGESGVRLGNSSTWSRADDSMLTDERLSALVHLLKEAWWNRGWVVREAVIARRAQVIWGTTYHDWDRLLQACTYLYTRHKGRMMALLRRGVRDFFFHMRVYLTRHPDFARLFPISENSPTTTLDLLQILNQARRLKLKDPRDRIYAYLNITSHPESGRITLVPDYEHTVLQVYHSFAIQCIKETHNLTLLDYITHDLASLQTSIPSWVPRWDLGLNPFLSPNPLPPSIYQASQSTPSISADGILSVQGVLLDRIIFASDVLCGDTASLAVIRDIWNQIKANTTASPYPAEHLLHAFLDALCMGIFLAQWRDKRGEYVRKARLEPTCACLVSDSPAAPEIDSNAPPVYFEYLLRGSVDKARIVLTERGYMGLVRPAVQKGDLCGMIPGCQAACGLREAPQKGQHYLHLGAVWLLGSAFGQADDGAMKFQNRLGSSKDGEWLQWAGQAQTLHLC
ncbi:hypothetical protein ACN47E_002641 [Coniothyrium glycines]